MKTIKLSDRLLELANLIDYDASVADIGTDHGYLPVYLAQSGYAKRIIASDISADSLSAARKLSKKHNVSNLIEFTVSPGLEGVEPNSVDTIIISGMGGETIIGILSDAPWTKNNEIKLILQPQSKIDLLCKFLYDNEYEIKKTISVIDRGKNYTVFLCIHKEA